MGLLHRKSRWERLVVEPISDSMHLPGAARYAMLHPPKGVKSGLATLGGVVGLTAGSAIVSSLRRRSAESRNDS